MMEKIKNAIGSFSGLKRQRIALLATFVLLAISAIGSSFVFAARTQDSRPRRSSAVAPRSLPTPTPTPTPVPRVTQPVINRPAVTPTPTPTPVPRSTPYDRVAPSLGEPPPAPILKPKPTPTPPEPEIDEGSTIVVNTELVTLNVRVIDRNNRPIDNVRENEFHVFEDGVPQPIENFSREEVPISYGLAVDTSGSLRSQLQAVIDAGKSIINSNKPGDETFLVRFISSDKIETVQDFTPNKDLLMDGLDSL